ncbi:endonuclease VIII [Aestuariibacter salexigens]|uniref:endonuclease VIII n=1 Tax=Aestuariibacter salexigens TaxID=226010 RepID=UPI00040C87BE|nr:endonuclease VIII [Aestuariibacter salexigens]
MPEGPEIRRAADQIADVLVGKTIQHIEVGLPALQPYIPNLTGQTVTQIESRGKALLTHFDCGLSVYSHNQLYGKWVCGRRGQLPPSNRSLRLALHTDSHSAVLYSASDIQVLDETGLAAHPFLRKIGPDILAAELTPAIIADRLHQKIFQNRKLAILFLDQCFIAGLGNYLRSEILFAARVHPDLTPAQLSHEQVRKLADATLHISRRSYDSGGYTVPEHLLGALHREKGDFERVRFMVFDREGLPCRECVKPIVRITRASRRLYLCPDCQAQIS